jgi:hypothetical protein
MRISGVLASVSVAALAPAAVASAAPWDVVVYGASPAGITAAITASDGGARVALAEPLTVIGGMAAAGGIGLADQATNNLTVVTGLAYRWAMINGQHYNSTNPEAVLHPDLWVAERSFWAMLNNASVTVLVGCPLVGASRTGTTLTSITVACNGSAPIQLTGRAFVDASYDGEVVVAAGLSYTSGRESQATYGEQLAGVFPYPVRWVEGAGGGGGRPPAGDFPRVVRPAAPGTPPCVHTHVC